MAFKNQAPNVYSSWGRTRRPKNIAGPDATEVAVVAVAALDAATDGYSTENQRYLHVLVIDKNVDGDLDVTLYGYNHAFAKWYPLKTLGQYDDGGGTGQSMVVTVADSTAAEENQTAAHRESAIYEIAGVDRVAFVGVTADIRVFAACSTF